MVNRLQQVASNLATLAAGKPPEISDPISEAIKEINAICAEMDANEIAIPSGVPAAAPVPEENNAMDTQ